MAPSTPPRSATPLLDEDPGFVVGIRIEGVDWDTSVRPGDEVRDEIDEAIEYVNEHCDFEPEFILDAQYHE